MAKGLIRAYMRRTINSEEADKVNKAKTWKKDKGKGLSVPSEMIPHRNSTHNIDSDRGLEIAASQRLPYG